jgi:predicted nucleic acid-binding protein
VLRLLTEDPVGDLERKYRGRGPDTDAARKAVVTAVGLAEIVDHPIRIDAADEEDVMLDLAQLGLLEAIEVDAAVGAAAGRLRSRHYHRVLFSMADCLAAEAARVNQCPLATSDPHLLDVCHVEGIDKVVLPNTEIRGPSCRVRALLR